MFADVLAEGAGTLRLAPAWVPRTFCRPGKRLKLHPADLYAFGANRGGIDERWMASTAPADNGPLTTPGEGLSYVIYGTEDKPQRALLRDVVAELGATLLGPDLWGRYHGWPVFAKFFDNQGPLPHHLHQMEEHARLVGAQPKPEAYYFPPQMNNHMGSFPHTFFGFEANTTRDQVRHCLEVWNEGDNRITDLSKAYRLTLGTGWDIPAGILHAPGSVCTYEPQWASDVFAMFQSLVDEVPIDWSLLVKCVPTDRQHDLDFIISLVDWHANVAGDFKEQHFRAPQPVKPLADMESAGYIEKWIAYDNPCFAAKELTVLPGREATVHDYGPYGLIMVQGHGTLNGRPLETPTLIHYGQLTHDEYFISASAASAGVKVKNHSPSEPLVMLKHFGPPPQHGMDGTILSTQP